MPYPHAIPCRGREYKQRNHQPELNITLSTHCGYRCGNVWQPTLSTPYPHLSTHCGINHSLHNKTRKDALNAVWVTSTYKEGATRPSARGLLLAAFALPLGSMTVGRSPPPTAHPPTRTRAHLRLRPAYVRHSAAAAMWWRLSPRVPSRIGGVSSAPVQIGLLRRDIRLHRPDQTTIFICRQRGRVALSHLCGHIQVHPLVR